jgi:hypothetical protein
MRNLVFAALLVSTPSACADGSGPDTDVPAELVGEWQADAACAPPCSFTLTWKGHPTAKFDAIALGMALRMEIAANGRFRFGDVSAMPPAGEVRAENRQLIVTDAVGVVDTIDYDVEGSALSLAFRREFVVLDFNADGAKDASTAAGVFVRR